MNFFDHLLFALSAAFLIWMFVNRNSPVKGANNTAPYWLTVAGNNMPNFDYASQSNYALEAMNNGY